VSHASQEKKEDFMKIYFGNESIIQVVPLLWWGLLSHCTIKIIIFSPSNSEG
jgi:hypothetical protein